MNQVINVESGRVSHVEMSTWNALSPVTKYPPIFNVDLYVWFHVEMSTWIQCGFRLLIPRGNVHQHSTWISMVDSTWKCLRGFNVDLDCCYCHVTYRYIYRAPFINVKRYELVLIAHLYKRIIRIQRVGQIARILPIHVKEGDIQGKSTSFYILVIGRINEISYLFSLRKWVPDPIWISPVSPSLCHHTTVA